MLKTSSRRTAWRRSLAVGLAAVLLSSGAVTGTASAADEDQRPIAADTNVPYLPLDFQYQWPKFGETEITDNLKFLSNSPAPDGLTQFSNLVFWDNFVAMGSYNGLAIYDVKDPAAPVLVSHVICPGAQGDLSKAGDLIFFSVDSPRSGSSCGAPAVAASSTAAWEGIRIFNVADPASPQYVGNVQTRCGSHTHTQVPDAEDPNIVYLYNGSYDTSSTAAYCKNPHLRVEVIKVDIRSPQTAAIANEVFLWDEDPATDLPAPFKAADRADGGASTSATLGCHDLTAYPAKDLLAAACEGDGLILDIKDRLHPVVLDRVRDANYAFWHTAQFNNDATKVIFQDELGGGSSATCLPNVQNFRGADAFYAVGADKKLTLKSYFKIPRRQSQNENCVTHEGNILPIPGRDIFVQAWYQGGVSIIDFTDIEKPTEIGYFDRGPITATSLTAAGYWATYFKDGYIYGSEYLRGFDTLKLVGDEFADAIRYRYPNPYNPSTQPEYTWGWKTAPVVPSGQAVSTVLAAAPTSVPVGSAGAITITAPAGTYQAGEYVDVWSRGDGDASVLASGRAAANGSFTGEFALPAGYRPGVHEVIVRGDNKLDTALSLVRFAVDFTDVAPGHQFYTEISWAAAKKVTTGYADGTYAPASTIARDALVRFLYKATHPGQTAPACTTAPFTDVSVKHPFCAEIAWAKTAGITTGYTDGRFAPAEKISRQATAAFIYRAANPGITPTPVTVAPFPDVQPGVAGNFSAEIAWAKDHGIVEGFSDGKFHRTADVARDATAAFVYRAFSAR
ncbi:hypothetical protein D1871_14710 [Nakamurella silvestris]|nr:hypothetical protein D1871_14710 [Nakamurella silvestris]